MRYQAFQAQVDMMAPARLAAELAEATLSLGPPWLREFPAVRHLSAGWEMLARAGLTHSRPDYGLTTVRMAGDEVPVREEVVVGTAFGDLVRFRKEGDPEQPRVLLVAPLSGHFATLLRGTVETLLPDNDVYITDWRNARDAPLAAGPFGFDEYVAHVIAFMEKIGPGAHLIGVCQPCAHALAAVAIMAEDDHPCTPVSMTLMAGPVDTRVNPTKVNDLAVSRSIDWFERELITTVPARYPGAGRRVYPGFVQLTAFPAPSAARPCSPWKGSATISARWARPSPLTPCAPTSSPIASATTCSPASATTASSTAASGRPRSTRWSATLSSPRISELVA